jgi:Big-like domain-containing protein
MQQGYALVLAVGVGVLVSACGGSDSPAASSPSPVPAPAGLTVTGLTIFGPQVVPTGSDVTYSATATLSNGVISANVRPTTWSSENGDVATIRSAPDGIGELNARRQGTVTISATHQGQVSTFIVDIRDSRRPETGANLEISYTPDPVPGRAMRCPTGIDPGTPTWTFTETIAETFGVGFTQENVSFTLYDEGGTVVYTDTFPEKYYFPANSVFAEEFCMSLFARQSGFYADVYEGVDDLGNRRAFTRTARLRLIAVGGASAALSVPAEVSSQPIMRRSRQRIR